MSETGRRRNDPELAPESAAPNDDRRHLDALLDAALEATFPASDPLAFATPHPPEAPVKKGRRAA
jgi:hypothetical protein